MRLFEYEAKQLFAKNKIPITEGTLCTTPAEVRNAVTNLDGTGMLKVQILSGGRGKAGGIRKAESPEQAEELATALFAEEIKGYPVSKILVDPMLNIRREYYLGVTIDRARYKIVVICSPTGGVDIEEFARKNPTKVFKESFDIDEKMFSFQAYGLGLQMKFRKEKLKQVASIIQGLYKTFKDYDCKLAEINPLVETDEGGLVAADARISVDDDALFRHPELAEMGIEKRHEEGEMTPREKEAREHGIPYLDLDGNIGMFPGGAGFGIMGNDFINYYGGNPANFMDSGGGPTPERLAKMLVLLDENPKVKAIFGARFGGISRCDDFAKGVIMFLQNHGLSKPMVMRMTGNNWEEGVRLFDEAKKKDPDLFENIEAHGIETPIEDIARRAVELSKGAK
ncbi:MAG: ATP-grasp domain-containing protein [Candidatus Zixiibacteriota bacterium]